MQFLHSRINIEIVGIINLPGCFYDCNEKKDITEDANAAGGRDGEEELREVEGAEHDDGDLHHDEAHGQQLHAQDVVQAEAAAVDSAAHGGERLCQPVEYFMPRLCSG